MIIQREARRESVKKAMIKFVKNWKETHTNYLYEVINRKFHGEQIYAMIY